jgi:hypothetical protein
MEDEFAGCGVKHSYSNPETLPLKFMEELR